MKIKSEFEDILRNSSSSIEETSKDTDNKVSLVDDTFELYDFDNIVDLYSKKFIKGSKPKSMDALHLSNDLIYLIEFKNSSLDFLTNKCNNCKSKPVLKIREKVSNSLIILLDIINEDISFARKNIVCILVVKNSEYIQNYILNRANNNPDNALKMFKKLYFKKTHTMTASYFQNEYIKNNWSF